MKFVRRFLTLIIAVLAAVVIIALMLHKAEGNSRGISLAISQAASEAESNLQSAASNLSSSSSSQANGAPASSAASVNGGQSKAPAIPVAKSITKTPQAGQAQAAVAAPVAQADIESVWGGTGVQGLTVYEYGKTLLGSDEKSAYVNIANAVQALQPGVEIKGTLTPTQLETVYDYYIYDHTEVFYIDGVELNYTQSGNQYDYDLKFDYKYNGDKSLISSMRSKMGAKALNLLAAAKSKTTDLGKEKALHDALIKACSYDLAAAQNEAAYPDSFSAYGALVNGKAVCEGYAQAMKLLLSSAGIKSLYISGQANGGSHAWNMVEIGGNWRYLDATFDDPVYSNAQGQYVSYNTVSYTYFNYKSSADHVVGTFDSSDPFSESSENYAIMPQIS